MKKKHWMLFRTQSCIYYFWNDDFPVLVSLPPNTDPVPWYWTGFPAKEMVPAEIIELHKIAATPKKRTFTLPLRSKTKYVIEARGVFLEEE